MATTTTVLLFLQVSQCLMKQAEQTIKTVLLGNRQGWWVHLHTTTSRSCLAILHTTTSWSRPFAYNYLTHCFIPQGSSRP